MMRWIIVGNVGYNLSKILNVSKGIKFYHKPKNVGHSSWNGVGLHDNFMWTEFTGKMVLFTFQCIIFDYLWTRGAQHMTKKCTLRSTFLP